MRVSLSNYEAATSDHPMVGKFLATLKMENSGIITFAPSSQDREWTVKFVRHKMRTVHSFHPPNYVVSVSTVNECSISQNEDISSLLTLDTGKHKPHIEVEVNQVINNIIVGYNNIAISMVLYCSCTTFFGKLDLVINLVSLRSSLLLFSLSPTRFLTLCKSSAQRNGLPSGSWRVLKRIAF